MSNGDPPPVVESAPPEPVPAAAPEPIDAGHSLVDIVKKFFLVADDAGDPEIYQPDPYSVTMLWGDESMVRVRFELRTGLDGAVGFKPGP